MNRIFSLLCLTIFALSVFGALTALAAQQTNCPVMGGRINPKIYEDYKGKRIHFCCPPCAEDFKNNPDFYLEKLKQMDQEPRSIKAE